MLPSLSSEVCHGSLQGQDFIVGSLSWVLTCLQYMCFLTQELFDFEHLHAFYACDTTTDYKSESQIKIL